MRVSVGKSIQHPQVAWFTPHSGLMGRAIMALGSKPPQKGRALDQRPRGPIPNVGTDGLGKTLESSCATC